jgi:hypothetical protein
MEILKTPPAFCLSKIRNSLQIFESSTPKTSTRDVFSAQDDTNRDAALFSPLIPQPHVAAPLLPPKSTNGCIWFAAFSLAFENPLCYNENRNPRRWQSCPQIS